MAYPRKKKSPPSSGRRSDRISGLTDDVLGHILSFLPTKEAARAAVLSRRWRHVFGSVHTISFEETEGEREQDWFTYYVQAPERKSCSDVLLDGLGARGAPLPPPMPRPRRAAAQPPLRLGPLASVGQATYNEAGRYSDEEEEEEKRNGSWYYILPRRLLSYAAIRTLCLSYCRLKLPEVVRIDLPLLETLRLTGLRDSGRSIQRLISSCPRLADVTLEALCKLKRVSLLDKPSEGWPSGAATT
nr:F-box/LRR-repeat protein At4g14103-like [Aegilops tauschii subsp. strangulata]